MRALLDTSVLSELSKPSPEPKVVGFLRDSRDEDLWISVLSIGEMVKGAEALAPGKRRAGLEQWIRGTEDRFRDRLIPVDAQTCRIWGELTGRLRRRGFQLPMADGLIAATAIQHDMYVVTRNVKDFEPTGVTIVNPWETGG